MVRGADVVLDVHVVVLFLVLVQHVRVRLQRLFELLAALVVQLALARILRRSVHVPGTFTVVLRLSQLLLVLHAPVLEPGFHLNAHRQHVLVLVIRDLGMAIHVVNTFK